MPTQTFFNLPDEKRRRIMDAVIEELAGTSFQNASIARIVESAGIPRGSFYQYFEDIKDVYKHLIEMIGEKKMERLGSLLQNFDSLTVFEALKELYVGGIEFAHENPELARFGDRFMKEDATFKEEMLGGMADQSLAFYEGLILSGQAKGEIDPTIDAKVGAFILNTLNISFTNHYLMQNKKDRVLDNVEEYLAEINKMLSLLENGFKGR